MKTFIIIFLLLVLTCPFWGTYSYFQFERKRARMEVNRKFAAGLDKTQLVLLKFTPKEIQTILNWKHSREFEYNGQMYDIVEQSSKGGHIIFTCYKDHKETRLKQDKERLIAKAIGQDPTRKSQTEKLTNFFKTVYSQDAFAWNPNPSQPSTIHFSLFTFHYSLFTQSPLTPPPKYA